MEKLSLTQSDVARASGVSRGLVSIALRGLPGVSDELRTHIVSTAENMGYRRNNAAARLASKSSNMVGVFILDMRNEVHADMYEGISKTLNLSQEQTVMGVGSQDPTYNRQVIDGLINARVDIIIASTFIESDETIREISKSIPIVSAGRLIEGVDSVFPNDIAGGKLAVQHLIDLGHTRIAHIASRKNDGLYGRRQAYEQTMEESGLPVMTFEADYNFNSAMDATRKLLALPEPPTAIFGNNDMMALGAMQVISEAGLRVPQDISIVGYDNTQTAHYAGINLTSVDIFSELIGSLAAEVAEARVSDPSMETAKVMIEPRLVVRGSTSIPSVRT